jgi:hypothetical protein
MLTNPSSPQATIKITIKTRQKSEMNINLNLPPELENELHSEASRLNLPLSEYILRILFTRTVIDNLPKTGEELVRYWQNEGVINSCPDIADSQAYARELRHQAETRERS